MPVGTSLLRAVEVVLDRASWRAQPTEFRHPLPRMLQRQRGPHPVHLLAMLLRLGELTTPTLNAQSGVARLWPLLRYLHVVADTPGFRFRAGWAETDQHQKAVASDDDLGVSLGMAVLYGAFDYTACVDGRAFLLRLLQLGMLASDEGAPPKIGVGKMADFAALDRSGKVHLIECKGTQHSTAALVRAMAGGQHQKRSLVCASPGAERRLIGQRLVVGALMVLEGATRDTQVWVSDPAPREEHPAILSCRLPAAALAEPALRLEVARALGTAVALRTAAVVSQADLSALPRALSGPEQRDRAQASFALDEGELETFEELRETWIGERIVAPLLEPLQLGDRLYRFARLAKGVSKELTAEIRERAEPSALFQEQYPGVAERLLGGKLVTEDDHAAIVRKGVSLSSAALLERRASLESSDA